MIKVPFTCTGCSACMNICPQNCIVMKKHQDGFSYPQIDSSRCIACNQCESVCPILNNPKSSNETAAFAIKNKNTKERVRSTSGGVFPLLAEYVIERNGIVFGAAYTSDFSVQHIVITEMEEIVLLQGAKYTQSTIGFCYSEIRSQLNTGRLVLFSGTPCQCNGLKAYLKRDYDNLIVVDIICHGVPSPKVWQSYIEYRIKKENSGKKPIAINMRSKTSGWSRYSYSTVFKYENKKVSSIPNNRDLFMKAFIGNICLRNSCSECSAKGVNRCTDFTLGDYWGIWDQYPEFDDDKGINIIFIHSKKGKNILSQLKDKFECIEVDINDAYRENMSLVVSSKVHEKRNEFLERTTSDNFEEMVSIYFLPIKANPEGNIQKIKNIVKTFLKKYIRNLEN